MQKIDIINPENVIKDVSSLVDHITSLTDDDRKWFYKVYFREMIRSKHYSPIEEENKAKYIPSSELTANAQYIMDWLAGLEEREPKQHGKLSRITFQQALGHSKKWHDELAKKAEQSERYIEPDAENAPKVLDLGDGWEVFWLKTKKAKIAEGEVMGHCVGNGAYDNLNNGEAIFSIRKNNVSHITLHMEKRKVKQAVTKGNGRIPKHYKLLVNEAVNNLSSRLVNTKIIRNKAGELHSLDEPAISNEFRPHKWYKNGEVHRLGGPAVIASDGTQEWWINGKRHREDGPAIIWSSGTEEWYRKDKLHRVDGPAVIRADGTREWYKNGLRHRKVGPAVIYANGAQEWWVKGIRYNEPDLDGDDNITLNI